MDRVIFGCSNVYRFFNGGKVDKTTYRVEHMTNLEKLEKALAEFKEDGKSIIVACVENAICDVLKTATDKKNADDKGKDAIDKFYDIIKAAKKRLPNSNLVVIKPLTRPGHKWYDDQIWTWASYYEGGARTLRNQKVVCMSTNEKEVQVFEDDGVHLTKFAGKDYVTDFLKGLKFLDNLEAEIVEMTFCSRFCFQALKDPL